MLVKKNKNGQKLLLPAQIAKIYNVSRPTAGKWAELALEGENTLDVVAQEKRIFVVDSEANHKELHLLREKGVKYKNKSDYEKIELNNSFVNSLSDNLKSELNLAFENKQLPLSFSLQYYPESFGGEIETPKERSKKQALQFQNFVQLFCNYQNANSFKITALEGVDLKTLEALSQVVVQANDLPNLNLIDSKENKIINSIDKKLFGNINQFNYQDLVLATILQSPVSGSHQINLVLLGNLAVNKSFDFELYLFNLSRNMSQRDYLIFNTKFDSVDLDLFAGKYFDSPKVSQRNKELLTKLGITADQYSFEYKYNEYRKAHQFGLIWEKEIDFVFGGQNLSFREGDKIVLEQLNCFSPNTLQNTINNAGLEIVQSASNLESQESWLILKKQSRKTTVR